jgi:cytosine deaminase
MKQLGFTEIAWPRAPRFWLANAKIPGCFLRERLGSLRGDAEDSVNIDVLVENGRISNISPPANRLDEIVTDVDGRQVWPTLVDIHTHLDKGHTVARNPNPDGSIQNARSVMAVDRALWSGDDLRRRMRFGLRCAEAHGVSAIRTHLDTYPQTTERSWAVFRDLREEWAGRITLQGVSMCPIDLLGNEYGERLAREVSESRGLLGGVIRPLEENGPPVPDNIDAQLDRLFDLAKRFDLDVDLHVDETHNPLAASLPFIARAAIRHGYKGRVTCGHCCSLANQSEEAVDRTLDLIAEADLSVVTLPTVNLYLQDRSLGRTPRWRGTTLVHEMLKRGINMAVAGDNCRDAFFAYGDHDMLDTFRQAVRILHLDHPISSAPALVGPNPARIGRLREHGCLVEGGPANFIVFNARTLNQIVSRAHQDRVVFRNGIKVAANVPDYDELLETEESR